MFGKEALRAGKSEPTMNLGWVTNEASTSDKERGTILHEFGHALGLLHEHQSPAREDAIVLNDDCEFSRGTVSLLHGVS